MKKTIQYRILFLLLVATSSMVAQQHKYMPQWYVSTGFGRATFEEYINSNKENTLDNTGYSSQEEPVIEGGYRFNIYRGRVKMEIGSQYHKYQINTAFRSGGIRLPVTYNLSYVGFKFGFRADLIHWKKLKLQVHTHFSKDWLIYGTNRFAGQFNDILKERTFDRSLLNLHKGFGLEYQLTNAVSASLTYNVANSFKEREKDSEKGEKYILRTKAVSLGIQINIPNKK